MLTDPWHTVVPAGRTGPHRSASSDVPPGPGVTSGCTDTEPVADRD
jgi:hypothetical protein